MKDNQNNQINFKSTLVNTEFGEKLAKFKLLSEFLSNSMIYYYQTAYTTKSFTQAELNAIKDKYSQIKSIVDDTIYSFQKDLDKLGNKQ